MGRKGSQEYRSGGTRREKQAPPASGWVLLGEVLVVSP